MPAQLTGLVGRLQRTIREFTVAQRTLAVIGVAVVVLGAMALSSWLSRPTMAPLFADLSAADASAVVDHLQSAGVTYELTDGGSTILVPADKLYAMRLEVAAAGLPTASDGGYSLLDDMGMTSSDFQQQVTYQRALEGELAKTIAAIQGVEEATVRLALPEESVFVSEAADPTASVFVRTTPGTSIDAAKVESIVHLVSAGIEGMAPTDVAVIDADGHVLSAVGAGATGGTGLRDGRTGEYEARLAANLQAMLDRLVGLGNAVVSVSADLDYDQTVRTTETHTTDPDLPPVSESTAIEEYSGVAQGDAGVLGPDGQPVVADDDAGEYRSETSTVNNPVNTVTEQLTTAPGSVRRQSVSVVVSEDAAADLDLGDLETAVAAAAGVDTERGDVVSVTRMSFDTTAAAQAEEALAAAAEQATAERSAELIKTGGIGVAVLLVLVMSLVLGIRASRRARREALDLGELELLEMRKAEAIEAATATRALPAAAGTGPDPVNGRREDIMALAAEQPAEVAEVLRGWLVGGRR